MLRFCQTNRLLMDMKVFLAGGTGATGSLLAKALLDRGHEINMVVRSKRRLPDEIQNHALVSIREASLLDLSDRDLKESLNGCHAAVSCLGHTLSFRGIYGKPRNLVTDATMKLCKSIEDLKPYKPIKLILMGSSGVQNRARGEVVSVPQRIILSLLRWLVPPHRDNEMAAEFLQNELALSSTSIEWAVIRPDSLVNEATVSPFVTFPSPIRSAIFDSGKTSRINVADFMVKMLEDDSLWARWKGEMPVLYNEEFAVKD